jgi:hypothetical protein
MDEERTIMETTEVVNNDILDQRAQVPGDESEEGLPFGVYALAFGAGILIGKGVKFIGKGVKSVFNLITGRNKKYAEVDHGKFTRVK